MMRVAKFALVAVAGLFCALPMQMSAQAADLAPYVEETMPSVCTAPAVLKRITARFSYQVRHVPNLPQVAISDFHRIHLRRSEPAGERWPIARHYCGAKVTLSDGRDRDIWYLVEEGQGFASVGDNVEFCVSGFDRWLVYNAHCRVVR